MASNGTLVAHALSNRITGSWRIVSENVANNSHTIRVTAETSGDLVDGLQYKIQLYSGTTLYLNKQGGHGFSLNTKITIPAGIGFTFSVSVTGYGYDHKYEYYT